MAYKGANTLVLEARGSLVNAINSCIKSGVPAAMVSIMLDSLSADLNNNIKTVVQQEKDAYEQQLQTENEQVEYKPEEQEVAEPVESIESEEPIQQNETEE